MDRPEPHTGALVDVDGLGHGAARGRGEEQEPELAQPRRPSAEPPGGMFAATGRGL
ncbi:MAG: hypothetical protein M3069_09215 [Chloroflexota bacterium]|nr:hypothetical protein [Chloroflexota bacterium]